MNKNLIKLWEDTYEVLKGQNLYDAQINTWFRPLNPIEIRGEEIIMGAPSEFILNHLNNNKNNYKTLLEQCFYEASGISYQVTLLLEDGSQESVLKNTSPKSRLNPKYTFDSFVVGKSNEFAHAASLAVAEDMENAHANPLFIYGGVGLGKTHLMHAIGHYMQQHDKEKNILYVTSEQFTNEFISSIQTNRNEEFRNKYRSVDLLLIDDIQFIADKESTMDEFFHTFNELHSQDKQIILTSDKPPKDIKKLEQRLISRFAWGLVVDIQPPDFETRMAILQKKAESENYQVPSDVINYIARHVQSNIRELEGALSRVMAYEKLTNGKLNEELAAMVLQDIFNKPIQKIITPAYVKEIVCKEYGLSLEEMDGKKRTKSIAYPRQVAMYLTRELTDLSLPKIGEEFGGRDHTTVIHAYDKIKGEMDENPETSIYINSLKDQIRES